MFKVIIAGSRHMKDYNFLKEKCDSVLLNIKEPIEIVSGKQVTEDKNTGEKWGADYLGELYAAEKGYPVKEFPADWNTFGTKAGPIRNTSLAEYADALIVFPRKDSKGSFDMLNKARKKGLLIRNISIDQFSNNIESD